MAVLPSGDAGSDLMVEGSIDERLSPEDVGWKIVAVNVTDLGATAHVRSGRPFRSPLPARRT